MAENNSPSPILEELLAQLKTSEERIIKAEQSIIEDKRLRIEAEQEAEKERKRRIEVDKKAEEERKKRIEAIQREDEERNRRIEDARRSMKPKDFMNPAAYLYNYLSPPIRVDITVAGLVNQGAKLLPPLQSFVGYTPTRSASIHKKVNIVAGPSFNFCNLPILSWDTSALLALSMANGELGSIHYTGEASLKTATYILLIDILKALDLYGKVHVRQQETTTDTSERGDLFVVTMFGVVALVVQVQSYANYRKSGEENHLKSLGQMFDLMQSNRECFSQSYCFGVWTTYNQCRVIWLNDDSHNALANVSDVVVNAGGESFPLPPDDYDWKARNVCSSQIYTRSDNIPKVMACLLWKLYHSKVQTKTMITRVVAESAMETSLKTMPHIGMAAAAAAVVSVPFNGRDGKVWVAANSVGRLAVAKFRRVNKNDVKFKFSINIDDEEDVKKVDEEVDVSTMNTKAEEEIEGENSAATSSMVEEDEFVNNYNLAVRAELQAWQDIYGALARSSIKTLAGREVLIIPFAFCFNSQGCLSSELKDYLPCEESFGNGMKDWSDIKSQLLSLSSSSSHVVQLLFLAVVRVAKSGYYHNDIKWEHLALLPVYESSTFVSLEPILIDLTDVEKQANDDGLSLMAQYIVENLLYGQQYESQRHEFEQLLADEMKNNGITN
eukprot:gene31948-41443_t